MISAAVKGHRKRTAEYNMFRLVRIEHGVTFYSQVLYASQLETLLTEDSDLRPRFSGIREVQGRHSRTSGLGDWKPIYFDLQHGTLTDEVLADDPFTAS